MLMIKKDLMDELKHKKIYGSALKSYKDRFCNSIKNLLVYINKKIKQYGLTTELYYYDYDNEPLKITCEDIKNLDTFSSLYIAIKAGDIIYGLIGRRTDDVYASSKYEDYVNVSLVLYHDYYAISHNEGISFDNVDELINYFITTKL